MKRSFFCTFSIFLFKAAIRFFRAVISARDDFYYKHIVKYNLFLPIVEIFKANKDKYNLLNSTILDIFEFILKVKTNIF